MAEYDPYAVMAAARLARDAGQLDTQQYANIHNQAAANVWSNRVNQMQAADVANPPDVGASLFQQYGPRQTALGDEARQAAARRFMDVSSGNVQATFRGSRMAQDPRFQTLYRDDNKAADALYQRTYGQSINEAMLGDQLGGNVSVSDVRRRQAMPDMQKAVFERMRGLEGAFGANPMDLIAPLRQDTDGEGNPVRYGYDPETSTAFIPGKLRSDGMGGFIQEPARSVHVPPEMYERLQNDSAMLSGFTGQAELTRNRAARQAANQQAQTAQRGEYEQLKQRREAEMAQRNLRQSAPPQLTGTIGNAMRVFSQPRQPLPPPPPSRPVTDDDIWQRILTESMIRNPVSPVARNF